MTRLVAVFCLSFLFALTACKGEQTESALVSDAAVENVTAADESKGKPYMHNPEGLPISSASFIIIDADGDGVELTPLGNPKNAFDADEDDLGEMMGWFSTDDAILFVQHDYFKHIEGISYRRRYQYGGGMKNLALLDFNNDGIVTYKEVYEVEHFGKSGAHIVAFDEDGDGAIDIDKYVTKRERYVTAFNLQNILTEPFFNQGHYVEHVGEATWNNGKVTKYWLVRFAYEDLDLTWPQKH